MTRLLFGCCLLLVSPAVAQDIPSAKSVLSHIDNDGPDSAALMEAHVIGVMQGVFWSNALLGVRKQQRIYCAPDDLPITGDKAISILRQGVKYDAKIGDMPLGFAMMMSLELTFPCDK